MNLTITSAQNPTVKHLRRLITSAKARREENQYIAEGIHLVRSYVLSGGVPKLYVLAQSVAENSEIAELVHQLELEEVDYIVLADSLFESIATIHASVGILVVFAPPTTAPADIVPLTTSAVLLDNIQDPGNMGTILRTAAAAGVTRVVLSSGCTSPWSPKSLRAGMGAQFALEIHEEASLAEVIEQATVPVYATVLTSDSRSLYDIDLRQPVAWLFGSEGQGVSGELVAIADTRVTIPQAETAVESLNVSAAVAVCLYEQYRQTM